MKPERARLSEFEMPAIVNREPGLFHDSQPLAGLGGVVTKSHIEVVQWNARVVKAPVQPPPARHLTSEGHAQGDRRALVTRCVDRTVEIECVEHDAGAQI